MLARSNSLMLNVLMMDFFLANMQLFTSQEIITDGLVL